MSESGESFAFLVLCRDLMLASKILATARANGVAVKQVRNQAALDQFASSAPVLIVDLNESGFLELASNWKTTHGGKVIGFAGHADAAAFAGARAAGLDQAMARGAFVAQLDQILR